MINRAAREGVMVGGCGEGHGWHMRRMGCVKGVRMIWGCRSNALRVSCEVCAMEGWPMVHRCQLSE